MVQVDYKELKNGCFMQQVQKDNFSLRLRIAGGRIQSDQLLKVYEISQKYGNGYVHMTSRQSIEIPFIKLQDIEAVKAELISAGLQPGFCGPRVRTITACQGNAVCKSGLIDTSTLAEEFDQKYCGREVPHKFKLGITGCRNNCLKAEENDLGVKGGLKPIWLKDKCSFCGLCETTCPQKAIKIKKQDKSLVIDEEICINCGKCVKICKMAAWEWKSGFIVYFGGLFGNTISIGRKLFPIIFEKEKLHKVIEVTLEFFKTYGKQGERFGRTLDRVGWEQLEKTVKETVEN